MTKELDLLKFLDQHGKNTGVSRSKNSAPKKKQYKSIPKNQRTMQNRILATSEKKQVLVKVIGSGKAPRGKDGKARPAAKSQNRKGMRSVSRLTDYLEKGGENTFESRDGNELLTSKDASQYIKDEWAADFSRRKNGSDFLHIVVSTPRFSDRNATTKAARDFGREFFSNNDYLMVRHDDTDYPHAHYIVKIKGDDGKRLNLNKRSLELARETFAFHSREHGIDVAASYRSWRGAQKAFLKKRGGDSYMSTASEHYDQQGESDLTWKDNLKNSRTKESNAYLGLSTEMGKVKGAASISQALAKHSKFLKDKDKTIDR
jgi:hypothetical protein